jgi:O-antigen polysaccharide polymerase Wzy
MIEIALAAQVVLWIAAIWIFAVSRQATIFHPVTAYLGFHGLVFVLRPILVNACGFDTNWTYMQFQPSDEVFMRTLAVSSVAMISFVAVCLYTGRSRISFGTQNAPEFTSRQRKALLITTLLLTPAVAYSIYATRSGIEGNRVNGIYILTNSTGYINEAQNFVMGLLCAWMVATRFHWFNLFPAALYILYRTWFGWSRWTILLFFLLVVMTYCWYNKRKWMPFWSVGLAIPILVLFNLLGHNRDLLKSYLLGQEAPTVDYEPGMSAGAKLKRSLDTQDFANFDFLNYVVWLVPDRTGTYTYGAQYLQLLTDPIPRILWKGKPVGPPVRTGVDMGAYGNFLGLTVSLAGDAWMSGGWIGLVIILSIAGWLLGLAHRRFWRDIEKPAYCLLFLVGLAMVPQWYRDGGIISIAKFLSFSVTPILIWMGVTWCLGPKLVPGFTVLLPPGARLRELRARGGRSEDPSPAHMRGEFRL